MALSKALQVGYAFGMAYLEADSDRTVKAHELRDWLVGYCGKPAKTKASKEAWSECRKAMCPVTGSINDVLKASADKHISEVDENTKRARLDLSIRVIKTKLLNGTKGAKKGASKRKTAKAIAVPMTPKGMGAMARVAIGALGKMEKAPFPIPEAVAAWQALAAVYAKKV
jgi:hypothetical protein